MASLVVVAGGTLNERIALDGKTEYVIGRIAKSDVYIPHESVSKEHARILCTNGRYSIVDRGSKNKTHLNGEQLVPFQPQPLKDRDRIKVCNWVFMFHSENTPIVVADNQSSSTVQRAVDRPAQQNLLDAQPSEKLHALLRISNALGKTFDEEELLSQIADILSNLFKKADRCFVIFRDQPTGRLESAVIRTRAQAVDQTLHFSKTIVEKVLDSGQALLFDASTTAGESADEPKSVAESRIRSAIIAPLVDRGGKAFGLIQLDIQDPNKTFCADDLSLLIGVANQAALALENAKLYKISVKAAVIEQDMQMARHVQRSFLPASLPVVPGYQFYAFYQAARNVGGDYYDFISDAQNRFGVFVGDVAGKGVTAALVMAKLCAQARACMLAHADLSRAIHRLNEQILQSGAIHRFITLSANILDPIMHRVTLVNAGHISPLIYRCSSKSLEAGIDYAKSGFPLGIEQNLVCEAACLDLNPGDCVIVFTDGVIEASDVQNKQFGMEGVHRAVLDASPDDAEAFTAQQIGDRIISAVTDYQSGKEQDDDIALVCFGRPATPLPESGEPGKVATATGPMTQSMKAIKELMPKR